MGYSLDGIFALGPHTLDADKKDAAIEYACETLMLATQVHQAFVDGKRKAADTLMHQLLMRTAHMDEYDLQNWEVHSEQEARETAKRVVDDLYHVWHEGARDLLKRSAGSIEKSMVFAGTCTYGDEPDGYGYQALKRAMQLGLFELLHID